MKKILKFIGNRFLIYSFIFLFIQQFIVAYSTWIMAGVGRKLVANLPMTADLCVFGFLLFLVFIPGVLSAVCLQKAKVFSIKTYVDDLSIKLFGRVELYNSNAAREKVLPWINGEAQSTIERSLDHAYLILSTLLNSVLNIAVISLAVHKVFLASYIFSIFISIICIMLSKKHISKATADSVESRVKFRHNLLRLWDNCVLGNAADLMNWQIMHNSFFKSLRKNEISLEQKTHLISSATMILSIMPVVSGSALIVAEGREPIIAALVVTLPRQIQILQTFYQTITALITGKQYFTRLVSLYESTDFLSPSAITDHIRENQIKVDNQWLSEIKLEEILNKKSGRVTITGANGSGKTCFLLHIKQKIGKNAHFMPSDTKNIEYMTSRGRNQSTGERALAALEEIIKGPSKVLLLDEWDANLDKYNIEKIEKLLNQGSKQKLIIEIRHKIIN